MNKIVILIAAVIVVCFYACDKIEGPTRENIAVDTTCEFLEDNSVPVKKVLVEDYTGHNCGNCPDAGLLLNDTLRNKYGENLIVISVHAGDYANVCPLLTCPPNAPAGSFMTDYKTEAGEDWLTTFSIIYNPSGMVDRIDYPNNNLKLSDTWDQEIQQRMNLPAKVRIRIQNTYDETERKVRACVETKFMEAMNGNYKLSVVLTEDSIIDWQYWYAPHVPELVPDFVHHHVLRGTLNTSYGVNVGSGSIAADTKVVSGYSMDINTEWNADRCAVVAFLYDETTYEVLQVEEVKIK